MLATVCTTLQSEVLRSKQNLRLWVAIADFFLYWRYSAHGHVVQFFGW